MGDNVNKILGAVLSTGTYGRFIPEPRSSTGSGFQKVMSTVASTVSDVADGLVGGDLNYVQLLKEQIQVQKEMQTASFVSNIEKSKHETQMAPVRNLKVG